MSKQNHEAPTKRAHRRPAASARGAAFSGRKPIAFARQLAAHSAPTPPPPPELSPTPPLPASPLTRIAHFFFTSCIQRLNKLFLKRRGRGRKLELQEIQQLGEKRFLAIVRVGKQRFLIGGAAASLSLLAELPGRSSAVIVPRSLGQESA